MYNFFRNVIFIGLSITVLQLSNYSPSLMTSVVLGTLFSLLVLLFDTLLRIGKHQTQYTELREASNSRELTSFKDDGGHLPNLYTFFKSIGVELIDRKNYLGDNKHVFERPYRFISDTKYVMERVIKDIAYINEVDLSKFNNHILYKQERFDSNKKERLEFFITNMKIGATRDYLIREYRLKYPRSKLDIKTSEEVKYIEDRKERLANIPNHLNMDFFGKDPFKIQK